MGPECIEHVEPTEHDMERTWVLDPVGLRMWDDCVKNLISYDTDRY